MRFSLLLIDNVGNVNLTVFLDGLNGRKGVEKRYKIVIRTASKYVISHVFVCRGFPAVCSTWL